MSAFFTDTSALAKRYIPETGAAWVLRWIEPAQGNVVIVSELATVEFASVLARRQREGTVSAAVSAQLYNDFLLHVEREYLIVNVTTAVLRRAGALVATHPLRTLDAIQLACALDAAQSLGATPTFVSADRNLLAAASAEGFPTDDPNAHP